MSYAGLWGQAELDVIRFIEKAGELGYDGVLLMAKRPHLSPLEVTDDRIGEIDNALQKSGVKLIGLGAYTDFLLPAPAEIPSVEMQELYVGECARITAALGGEVVRVFTGYDRETMSSAAQERTVAEALARCADRAAGHDILLSVQNHHDLGVDTRAFGMLLDLIDRENIRAGYDAWSPYLRGENMREGAKAMAPKMHMTICADYLTFPRYRYQPELVNYRRLYPDAVKATTFGEGDVDYAGFFEGLREGSFDGWVVYEMCSPLTGGGSEKNLDGKSRSFLEYIAKL